MTERLKVHDWKSCGRVKLPRGFESHPLRCRADYGGFPFRHTCASVLFAAGKNLKQVQEWLGHADPGFTLRTYVHLMDDGLGDAQFLDDLASPEVGEPGHEAGETAA